MSVDETVGNIEEKLAWRKTSVINKLSKIENLVFQGGGVKGIAYLGVLDILLDTESVSKISLNQIKRVAGASAGAITAFLLAIGKSLEEMKPLIKGVDFTNEFLDDEFPLTEYWETKDAAFKLIEIFNSDINKINLMIYYLSKAKDAIFAYIKYQNKEITPEEVKSTLTKVADAFRSSYLFVTSMPFDIALFIVDKAVDYILNNKYSAEMASAEKELLSIFKNIAEISNFNDAVFELIKRILFNNYLFPGKKFLIWLEDILKKVPGCNEKTTFREFHELKKNNSALKELYVVALNVGTGITKTFSFEHTPDVLIVDCVRASMSIPYFFQIHKIRCKNMKTSDLVPYTEQYNDPNKGSLISYEPVYADGGILDNYPIWIFDRNKYPTSFFHQLHENKYNPKTLGVRLVVKRDQDFFENKHYPSELTFANNKFLNYTFCLGSALYAKQDNDHYHSRGRDRTIYVDTKNISFVDFNITEINKDKLIQCGKIGAINYLQRMNKREEKEYDYSFRKSFKESVKVGSLATVYVSALTSFISFVYEYNAPLKECVSVGLVIGLGIGASEFLSRITTNSQISYFPKKNTTDGQKSLETTIKTVLFSSILIGISTGLLLKNRNSSEILKTAMFNIFYYGVVVGGAISEASRGFIGIEPVMESWNSNVKNVNNHY